MKDIYRKGELDRLTLQMLQLGYRVEAEIDEIAVETNLPEQEVRRNLIRAMRKVIKKAKKRGILDGE